MKLISNLKISLLPVAVSAKNEFKYPDQELKC